MIKERFSLILTERFRRNQAGSMRKITVAISVKVTNAVISVLDYHFYIDINIKGDFILQNGSDLNPKRLILEEERVSIAFLINVDPTEALKELKQLTDLMELLGVGDYFKTKVSFNLSNRFKILPFQLEAVRENWREAFSLPQRSSINSRSSSFKSASSPTRRSLQSHALLNSPVSSSQRRNFDKSERDRYFSTLTKLDGKFIQYLRRSQSIMYFLS